MKKYPNKEHVISIKQVVGDFTNQEQAQSAFNALNNKIEWSNNSSQSAYDGSTISRLCLYDLLDFGMSVYKTEIKDGKPCVRYLNPISIEQRVEIYNQEHTNTQMSVNKK